MSDNYELLKSIQGRNRLNSPDGRQLCLYRCTDEEYALLQDQLLHAVEIYHKLPNSSNLLAASFCLYASEWWRKNYESGPWSWSEVLESINLDRDSNLMSLYPLLSLGLAYWKRKVLTVGVRSVYLVTLACEGGLPLKLLSSQKDVHLQKYFRALLREFQVYGLKAASSTELAARVAWLLPKSLQHEVVFQISGSLIEKIWELQAQLGQTLTPIEDLDRSDPNWRDKLPLVVSDETARTLLNNLVKAAIILAARATQVIKVVGILNKLSQGYQLTREIQLPASMDATILAEFLAIEPREVPYRLQIVATDARGGRHHASLVTRRTPGDEGRFAFEFAKGKKFALADGLALLGLKVEAVAGKDTFAVRNIVGGDELSALPWVFVAKRGESESLELVGEGGVKTSYPVAYVAISEDTVYKAEEGGTVEKIGELPLAKRVLLQVSGCVKFWTLDNITKVRTATVLDESSQYFLEGSLLATGGHSKDRVFSGFPNLIVCSETGCRRMISVREIQFKVRGLNKPWSAVSDTCLGPLSIRHIVEGETRFLADVDIVPATGFFKFLPGVNTRVGKIQVAGFRTKDVGIVPVPGMTSSIQAVPPSDDLLLDLSAEGEPPALVCVCLRWAPGQELTLSVPFPTRGGRFLGRDGKVLPSGENVHIDRLGGVVAQVFALNGGKTFSVTASLNAQDVSPELTSSLWIEERLLEVSPGRNEIDLRSIQEGCNLLFSMTADLDATIRVSIVTDACQVLPRSLKIARYDATFEPDRRTGEVVLPAACLDSLGNVVELLRLEAFPLWDPQAKPEELSHSEKGRWQFLREGRAPGPWLITGWEGEWCRVRPFLWTVFETQGSDAIPLIAPSADPIDLETAVRMGTFAERKAAFKELVALLAANPNHPDWAKVDSYMGYLQYLPATTFDFIGRLARNPDAAALCLMRSRADSFDTVWVSLERLPFSWALIPVSSWVKAARLQRRSLVSALAPIIDTLGQDMETFIKPMFQTFFDQAPVRLPGLQAVVELIQYLDFDKPLVDCQYLSMVSTAQGRQMLKQYSMGEAYQILLQAHADDQWPELPGPEEAILRQACVSEAFNSLWYRQDLHFRHPVLNAPVAAAMAAVCGVKLSREHIFHFRKLREFDIPWFDAAFACSLAVSLGYIIENDKGFWS